MLGSSFEQNAIDWVEYKQWVTTDRCNLKTVTASADESIAKFVDRIPTLLRHSFIASQQTKFLKDRKIKLQDGETLVICENYAMLVQDTIAAFHWTNTHATIHPFAIYLKNASSDSAQFFSFTIVSDCLKHDSVTAYLFFEAISPIFEGKFQCKEGNLLVLRSCLAVQEHEELLQLIIS